MTTIQAKATVTDQGGLALRDPPPTKPKPARDRKVNANGVIVANIETVRVPIPKAANAKANVEVAEHNGRWYFGVLAQCGSDSFCHAPSIRGNGHAKRDEALRAGLSSIARHFSPSGHETHVQQKRMATAAKAVAEFVDRLATQPPDTNGHPVGALSGEVEQRSRGPNEAPPDDIMAQTVCMFSLHRLVRHPKNRHPTAAAVGAMAESLKRPEGQLEALVTRTLPQFHPDAPLGAGPWRQIISGETRQLGAMEAGWISIATRNVQCDDARALELLVDFNCKRTDLSPIDKARQIRDLCAPKSKGGAGFTRKAAGAKFDVSESEASNMERLLALPPYWSDAVADGSLPPTFARELLLVLPLPSVMEALRAEFENHKAVEESAFENRETLKRAIQSLLAEQPRLSDLPGKLTKADRASLEIVDIELPTGTKGTTERVVLITNKAAFKAIADARAAVSQFCGKCNKPAAHEPPDRKVDRQPRDSASRDRPTPDAAARPAIDLTRQRRIEYALDMLLQAEVDRATRSMTVDDMAAALGIDSFAAWTAAQDRTNKRGRQHFMEFLEVFDAAGLRELGKELDVFIEPGKSKPDAIKKFLSLDRCLPLPKCLRPGKPKKAKR